MSGRPSREIERGGGPVEGKREQLNGSFSLKAKQVDLLI